MKTTMNANVLKTNESRVRQRQQKQNLHGEHIWNRFNQSVDQEPKHTPNHYSFYR